MLSLPVRTLECTPIFPMPRVYLLFPHIIFMSIFSSLNGYYLLFFTFRLLYFFFLRTGLRYIELCHFDCLIYVPERAAGSGN